MVLVPDVSGRRAAGAGSAWAADRAGTDRLPVGAGLFYANADHFADEVRELVDRAPAPIQWLVFDAEAIGDVDLSAAQTIRSLLEDLNRKGVRVVFGRVNRYPLSEHETPPHRRGHRRRANFPDASRGAGRDPRRGVPD